MDCSNLRSHVKKAIVLIDSDLGFLFWLGQALDHAGYEAFPARNMPDVLEIISEFHLTLTLAIVNGALPGAEALVRQLRETNPGLPVLWLVDSPDLPVPDISDDTLYSDCIKPAHLTEDAKTDLLRRVHNILQPRPATMRFRV